MSDPTPARGQIGRGARGVQVRDLQARLQVLGFSTDGDGDEEFGSATEDAVRRFQATRGLRVDGICGPQTWGALIESEYALGGRLLYDRQPMLRGDDVAALQHSLNALGFNAGKEDGIFGPATARGLRDFQRNAGATIDGICGPETLALLGRLGRDASGSVAAVKERELVLSNPPGLAGQRVFVAAEVALDRAADAVAAGLALRGVEVALETAVDDQSKLAVEANAWEADLVLVLRGTDESLETIAFYARGDFRSERGHRLAECIAASINEGASVGPGVAPVGRAYAVLRETKAPAVVCELFEKAGDRDQARVGELLLRGIDRAAHERPEACSP